MHQIIETLSVSCASSHSSPAKSSSENCDCYDRHQKIITTGVSSFNGCCGQSKLWRHEHHHKFGHLSVTRILFVGASTHADVSAVVQLHTSSHVSSAVAHDTIIVASSATVKVKLCSAMIYNDCIYEKATCIQSDHPVTFKSVFGQIIISAQEYSTVSTSIIRITEKTLSVVARQGDSEYQPCRLAHE